jgi:hypothetical protein
MPTSPSRARARWALAALHKVLSLLLLLLPMLLPMLLLLLLWHGRHRLPMVSPSGS